MSNTSRISGRVGGWFITVRHLSCHQSLTTSALSTTRFRPGNVVVILGVVIRRGKLKPQIPYRVHGNKPVTVGAKGYIT